MLGDVLCLSHLRWGFVFQRPNHLMSRWARQHRVFFLEEPLFDAASPRLSTTEVSTNLHVVVPHLPKGAPGRETLAAQRALFDDLLARWEIRSPLLWFYTPMAFGFAGHADAAVVVYDCMDELSAFQGAPPELHLEERRLFAKADLVFTGGHSLYESKRAHHRSVHAFPSSVDARHFGAARMPGIVAPRDQRPIPRPRLGFFGVLDERMDTGLLALLADSHPEWHVVLVGPTVKIDPASLPRRPNLHYLGQKRYDALPSYLAGWDVALMPFARNEATRFISPTKTLEYLAAGVPVVSTPIRDVVRPYGDRGFVRIGEGKGFVQQVEEALRERTTAAGLARQRAALEWVASTSWDRTWEGMRALVLDAAARRASVA